MIVFFQLCLAIVVYTYAIYKAYKLKDRIVIVNAHWLGAFAVVSLISAVTMLWANSIINIILATSIRLTFFGLVYTAKPVKTFELYEEDKIAKS